MDTFQKWIDKEIILVVYLFRKWNKEEEAVINVNKFEGAIRSAGTTQEQLSEEMHMSANTFTNKKKNGTFTIAEVDWLCRRLKIVRLEDKCDIFLPA